MTLIPLELILFGRNPPAGMDLAVIGLWTARLRKTAEPVEPPIQVTIVDHCYYRVHDGRHRVFGAYVAGRTHIEAEIITDK